MVPQTVWCILVGKPAWRGDVRARLSGKSKAYGSFSHGNSCRCFVGRCFPSISRDRDRRDSPPKIRRRHLLTQPSKLSATLFVAGQNNPEPLQLSDGNRKSL